MELNDILVYQDLFHQYDFNTLVGKGSILLNKDGWFEGLINEPEEKFIYGVYYPENVIILFIQFPSSISKLPLAFTGKRDAKGYVGQVNFLNSYNGTWGNSYITTGERNNANEEIIDLELRIENYKKNKMNETEKECYSGINFNKNALTQLLSQSFENGINIKEIIDLLNMEIPPETEKTPRKLARKAPESSSKEDIIS